MDDNLWLMELESTLLDDCNCNVNDIYRICEGKSVPEEMRPDVWRVCLDVRNKSDQMSLFNEIYDLPFQQKLRDDCHSAVERIGNDDEDKVSVLSDLESILTFYCKNRNLQYESDNGWIELLLPLLSLKLQRSDTYNLFEAIRDTYVPKGCKVRGTVFHVFRLLLQYHDPELCSLLDTKRISADAYAMHWFRCLFAANCNLSVILCMWDMYFQYNDPFMIFFMALIILINGRAKIMEKKDASKQEIVDYLSNMPCTLQLEDVVDFCSIAQYYSMKTPNSFKTDFLQALFGHQQSTAANADTNVVAQALCLPVSVFELVENSSMENAPPDSVRFFLVDCRPAEQYNAGHLSTAFHLDCNLMLQEPAAFATAVQGLLTAQRQALEARSHAGGEHLCFMGSGRIDEDQYTHMVVASFLQKNTQYVSLLSGGYTAIHDYFGDHMADCLEDHDVDKCIVCTRSPANARMQGGNNGNVKPKVSSDLFSKFSAVMKLKSTEVKDKLLDIIVNPGTPSTNVANASNAITTAQERHVVSAERNGKRYRNVAPVFSIDDENDDPNYAMDVKDPAAATNGNNESNEIVSLNKFLKSPDIINAFKCQEVHMNGYMYDSNLIITSTHLIVLRELGKGQARMIVRRPLESIVKITAKKRHRDLITFKYGFPDGDGLLVTDMDRFLIPNASAATALISKHIVQNLDGAKLT